MRKRRLSAKILSLAALCLLMVLCSSTAFAKAATKGSPLQNGKSINKKTMVLFNVSGLEYDIPLKSVTNKKDVSKLKVANGKLLSCSLGKEDGSITLHIKTKSTGKTKVTWSVKDGKKTHEYTLHFEIRKWVNPFTSLKCNGVEYAKKYDKCATSYNKKAKITSTTTISFQLKNGYSIEEIDCYTNNKYCGTIEGQSNKYTKDTLTCPGVKSGVGMTMTIRTPKGNYMTVSFDAVK